MGQQILGRKQKISNDAWLEAMKQIEDLVSKSELDARVGQTVKDIMATTNGKMCIRDRITGCAGSHISRQ